MKTFLTLLLFSIVLPDIGLSQNVEIRTFYNSQGSIVYQTVYNPVYRYDRFTSYQTRYLLYKSGHKSDWGSINVSSMKKSAQEPDTLQFKEFSGQNIPTKMSHKSQRSRKFNASISFGLNLSSWRGDRSSFINILENEFRNQGLNVSCDERLRCGINIGVSLYYAPVKWLLIQPEVSYINQGMRIKGDGDIDGIDFTIRTGLNVNYLQIPLVLKAKTRSGFFMSGGGFVQFQLYGRMVVTVEAGGDSESDHQNLEHLNGFDYGIIGGIGYQDENAAIEFRYINGFNDVFVPGTNFYNFRNMVFELKFDVFLLKPNRKKI